MTAEKSVRRQKYTYALSSLLAVTTDLPKSLYKNDIPDPKSAFAAMPTHLNSYPAANSIDHDLDQGAPYKKSRPKCRT